MRLAAFTTRAGDPPRLGAVLDGDRLADLGSAAGTPDREFASWLTPDGLAEGQALAASATPDQPWVMPWSSVGLAPAVPNPGKIIAAGRNYESHLKEGQEVWAGRGKAVRRPAFPAGFIRVTSSLVAHGEPIRIPPGITTVDYELELAVVIGRPALRVSVERALDHVAGYSICNDVSAREIQLPEMEQLGILMAKNYPGFGPLGPWIVTADELPDPQALDMRLTVNGELRQEANTREMLFGVAELIAHWSQIGLQTGDVIITGTPSGVALAMPEPDEYYLRAGDSVSATIDGIGTLTNPVR